MNGISVFKKKLSSYKYIDNDFAFLNLVEFENIQSCNNDNLYYHIIFVTEGEGSIIIGSDKIELNSSRILILTPFIETDKSIQINQQLKGFFISLNIDHICSNERYLQPMIDKNARKSIFGVIKYIFEKEEDQGYLIYNILQKIVDLKLQPGLQSDFQLSYTADLIKIFWLSICEMQHSQKNTFINRVPLQYELHLFYNVLKTMQSQLEITHNLNDIEQKLNITSAMMKHLCFKYGNETPKMLFQKIIVSKAKYSLLYTVQSIKEIAFSLGFSLPTNFNNFFSKHEEMTPLDYRHLYRVETPIEEFS